MPQTAEEKRNIDAFRNSIPSQTLRYEMSSDQEWLQGYKQRLHGELSSGQAFLAEYDLAYLRTTSQAIAEVFDQSGLDPKCRELIVLAVLAARGSWDAVRMHVRRALLNKIPPREILGAFKVAAVSAGLPVAVGGAEALKVELDGLSASGGGLDGSQCDAGAATCSG